MSHSLNFALRSSHEFTSQHDTYADRMNILSLIYSITPPPHSPSSTVYPPSVSTSTDSTQPPSPVSGSPGSESSHHLNPESSVAQLDGADVHRLSQETAKYELFEGGDSSERKSSSSLAQTLYNISGIQLNLPSIIHTLPRVSPSHLMMTQRHL